MGWESDIIGAISNKAQAGVSRLSPPLELAEVVSAPPDLAITLRGLEIGKENLYINDHLLKDYTRTVDITWSDPYLDRCDHTGGAERHIDPEDAKVVTKDDLKVGDMVAVIPFPGSQSFLILCKAVKA